MFLYEDMWDRFYRKCPFYAALRAYMDLYGDMKNGCLLTIPNFISMYSPSKNRTGGLSGSCVVLNKEEPDTTSNYIMRGLFSQSFLAEISHFLRSSFAQDRIPAS